MTRRPPAPKKSRPEARRRRQTKRTNEIGTVIPLLDQIEDIGGKTLTADALLTQRKLAAYLLERNADYLLTVKNNQPTLRRDIALLFATVAKAQPDFEEPSTIAHGRIEQRAIWTTTALNEHLNFPGVGQVFMPPRTAQQSNRKGQHRNRLRRHKPHPRHRQCTKHPDPEPRPLVHRKHRPPLPRLVMG